MPNPIPDEAGPAVEATRAEAFADYRINGGLFVGNRDEALDNLARAYLALRRPSSPPDEPPSKTAPVHFTDSGVPYTTAAEILASEKGREEIAKAAKVMRPPDEPSDERKYPCDRCGTMRTKAEGGTIFTLCDECWDRTPEIRPTPDEAASRSPAPPIGAMVLTWAEVEHCYQAHQSHSCPICDGLRAKLAAGRQGAPCNLFPECAPDCTQVHEVWTPPTYTRSDLEAVAMETAKRVAFDAGNVRAPDAKRTAAEVVTRYLQTREK